MGKRWGVGRGWGGSPVARDVEKGPSRALSGSWPMVPAVLGALLGAGAGAAAQEVPVVVPGDGTLRPGALVPFEAEYRQMGYPFHARLARTGGDRPVLSFQMVMEGPNGVGIDHVGHYADDLGFAYRRFGFGAFRDEYIEVADSPDGLVVRRMPRSDGPDPAPAREDFAMEGPVVDGTFLYWALGALPLGPGSTEGAWRFRTWSPTAQSVEVRDTPVLRAQGLEVIELDDGSTFEATIIAAEAETGTFRMWVVDRPPYLLRQDHVAPDGTVTEVIRLVELLGAGGAR